MTRVRISAADIAALGDRLGEIADHLEQRAEETRGGPDGGHGFIARTAEDAVDTLFGDYELERVDLCARLRSLARLAQDAGACYVETEDMIVRRVTPEHVDGRKVGLR